MSDQYLPCPFCGGTEIKNVKNSKWARWAKCLNINCGAEGPMAYRQTTAAEAWNRRAGMHRIPGGISVHDFVNGCEAVGRAGINLADSATQMCPAEQQPEDQTK